MSIRLERDTVDQLQAGAATLANILGPSKQRDDLVRAVNAARDALRAAKKGTP